MVKVGRYLSFFLVASIMIIFSISVYADDTSLGRMPEGVFPMQEEDIAMESEEIIVDLEKNHAECIFEFHNTGEAKTVLMGFPGKCVETADSELTHDVNLEIRNFKTVVKNKELKVTHQKAAVPESEDYSNALRYSEYFTFNVAFKADERVIVRNTYDFTPTYDSCGNIFSGYILKTGAMWKGVIGSAKVVFKLGKIQPYQLEDIKPGGFKFDGNNLVWQRKDFEPKYDLWLYYNTYRYGEEYLKDASKDEKAKIEQKVDTYTRVKKLAEERNVDALAKLYKNAQNENELILSLYIAEFLPADKLSMGDQKLGEIIVEKQNDEYYVYYDGADQENAHVQLTIDHIENGNKITDIQVENASCYIKFLPGINYTITCKQTDWLDQTKIKTIEFKVPEDSTVALPSQRKSEITPVNPPEDRSILHKSRNKTKIVVWMLLSGIFFILLIMMPIVISRKIRKM